MSTTPRGGPPPVPPRNLQVPQVSVSSLSSSPSPSPSSSISHPLMSSPVSTSPPKDGSYIFNNNINNNVNNNKGTGSTPTTPRGKVNPSVARNSVNFSEVSGDVVTNMGASRYSTSTPPEKGEREKVEKEVQNNTQNRKIPPSSSTSSLAALDTSSSAGSISSPHLSQIPRSFSLPQQMNTSDGRVEDVPADFVVRSHLSSDEVSPDESGLTALMKAGSWRSVCKLSDKCIASSSNPQLTLQYKLCKAVSLTKTRNYKAALDEINAIGDFNDPGNCFESYPSLFPGRRGSMVPFSLLILKAELLYVLGSDQSLDPLYNLLSYTRREIERLKAESSKNSHSTPGEPHTPSYTVTTPVSPTPHATTDDPSEVSSPFISIWKEREKRISLLIATHLVALKEYLQALSLIEPLATNGDIAVLTALGRIHLQLGCVKNAQLLFHQVEKKCDAPDSHPLVLMNRGYIHLALDQYQQAIENFDSVLQVEPNNIAAANNRSICWLYTCELTKAIASLENLIQRDPENNLDESLIFNLCTLYDLASDRSTDKKKSIMGLVAKFAPDSFDFRVFKINS